ncbi:MAG: BrnT family toxin [Alkalispirochaeta sp.]
MPEFEFDLQKSASNKKKHGIDFDEAQGLWQDPDRLVIPARSDDEERFALLAEHQGKVWAAFYTIRNDATRIISVRRARETEEAIYES